MAKRRAQFVCRECGAVHARWLGKCSDCGAWDALEEHRPTAGGDDDAPMAAVAATIIEAEGGQSPQATPITEVDEATHPRLPTGIAEFDRVLGRSADNGSAGVVPGSVVLVGGDPGIGKSTLLLQAAHRLASGESDNGDTRAKQHDDARPVLYVSSEESAQQTRLRAQRLGVDSDNLFVLADTNIARIIEQVRRVQPGVVIIDSIQMIYKGDLTAAPGSVSQLRSCCMELVYLAKATGVAVFLVGHVTKQGQLAGPRLLEHMVDTVLYFEGDRYHSHRIVRAIKNRFGTTLEVGLFEMTDAGLREAPGSGLVAAEYQSNPGSVVCPVLQGSRCLLVELQALTAPGFLGSVKRKTSGVDGNRLAMLIAVLEKRAELRLADQDVFTSSVGGIKIVEPAADLALALAIAGAHLNKRLGDDDTTKPWCAVGEIGLGGELRHVNAIEQRLTEAARLGFGKVVCPPMQVKAPKGCELIEVSKLDHAVQLLM